MKKNRKTEMAYCFTCEAVLGWDLLDGSVVKEIAAEHESEAPTHKIIHGRVSEAMHSRLMYHCRGGFPSNRVLKKWTKERMAATLGAAGGKSTSEAKQKAARENGKKGGATKENKLTHTPASAGFFLIAFLKPPSVIFSTH